MPADALPVPWARPGDAPVRVHYRREYRDVLGRPLVGRVRLTCKTAIVEGHVVIPSAPVEVVLDGEGAIDEDLPPGEYLLVAQLTTADGAPVPVDRDDIVLAVK